MRLDIGMKLPMYNVAFLIKRCPGMSRDDFLKYYEESHGPLMVEMAKDRGLVTYEHFPVELPPDVEDGVTLFDAFSIYSFETMAQADACWELPDVLGDGQAFIDMDEMIKLVISRRRVRQTRTSSSMDSIEPSFHARAIVSMERKQVMADNSGTTLRLLFPQWQGGNNPAYAFGAELLSWLAPEHAGPIERVGVTAPNGRTLSIEEGILARHEVLAQADEARRLIDLHRPDRLVTLGGDCAVDLAPMAYLNERYDGELSVLWVDTHSDVLTKDVSPNAHAHPMGSLLGEGDVAFTAKVKRPIKPQNVLFAGRLPMLESWPEARALDEDLFERLKLRSVAPEALSSTSEPVLEWLRSTGAKHVAIHFDLDVLDPTLYRSLLFANPDPAVPQIDVAPSGRMTMDQVARLLSDVARHADVVGLAITEHLPWDSLALRSMLARLPLIGSSWT